MNLRALVAVTGRPGLFKLIGQNKSGFILESLDEQKIKSVVNLATTKLATLEDITIFGNEEELKLVDILDRMKEQGNVPDAKADGKTLRQFFREVAPAHDEERVYASDIKKIITWYHIIKGLPLFHEEASQPAGHDTEQRVQQP
ncbi:DUF5606 family protein [Parapedobacter koreensis]|uniref:Uncharacterized protein n=1 Tax=Parapedobacter koreensis TaxID=332977 RepID=A0A1H7TLJ1_9SPHI|nr:DUF5606 domain-containing protein [Parapedobacter koreensis]SEL84707.1 hypothetical protein SAMN05421740_11194 [Parapedobacter koreensis]